MPRAYAQETFGLLITEIMADPTPSHGLPEEEYIEIYNPTDSTISLKTITLFYATFSVQLPDAKINPSEYVILVRAGNQTGFSSDIRVLTLARLSLNNSGTTLLLKRGNELLHQVTYSTSWYKKGFDQGYSLELIDLNFPCVEAKNWTSSAASVGGSPSKKNASTATNPDIEAPKLLTYELLSDTDILLVFNEKLAANFVSNNTNFDIGTETIIASSGWFNGKHTEVLIKLERPITKGKLIDLKIKNATDCSGNVAAEMLISVGVLDVPQVGDILLNEVLFNPRVGAFDFVEIYNTSDKPFALKNWQLANVDTNGDVSNTKTITVQNVVIQPNQYKVLTIEKQSLKDNYAKAVVDNVVEMASMPTFPNDKGSVVLLNEKAEIFDRLDYLEEMHHPLIADPEGVSLERIDVKQPTNQAENWMSASALENFATPGYQNSQAGDMQSKSFWIEPKIFTPDGDGDNEITTINFSLKENASNATITIFDVEGRLIRKLIENQVVGLNGSLEWDGSDSVGVTVPIGYYIIVLEYFSTSGYQQKYMDKVVVGRKY